MSDDMKPRPVRAFAVVSETGRLCAISHTKVDATMLLTKLPYSAAIVPVIGGVGAMTIFKIGKKRAGRLLDGMTHDRFPLTDGA